MEKISNKPKMSKLNLNCMFFEINLSQKGDIYTARTSSLAKIKNIKNPIPESSSTKSFELAVQKLIPKIETALEGTN